jgi:hypothetical protein
MKVMSNMCGSAKSLAVPTLVMGGPFASFFSSSVMVFVIFGFVQNLSNMPP